MFQILEDNELISSARSGDNEAITRIITELMPCVEAAARQYSSSSMPVPDLIQEGLIGAVNSVFSFDKTKGIKFSTYANVCISNSIVSAVRKSARNKHRPLNDFVPLEDIDFSAGKDVEPE